NLRKEGRHDAHDVSSRRTKRDQRIHIRAAMACCFKSSTMKLPPHDCPDGSRKCQQEKVLAREAIHEKHIENQYRHCEHDTQDQQVALVGDLCLPTSALLILLLESRSRCAEHIGNGSTS